MKIDTSMESFYISIRLFVSKPIWQWANAGITS